MAKSQNTPTVNEADQELLEQLDAGFPPAWIAEEAGETIVGTFVRLDQGRTAYGPCPVIVLDTGDGELRSVFVFYESLKSGLRRAQPIPGERVAIRYDGLQPVKNQTEGRRDSFHSYRVAVDRPKVATGPVDWNAALGPDTAGAVSDPPEAPAEVAGGSDDIPF